MVWIIILNYTVSKQGQIILKKLSGYSPFKILFMDDTFLVHREIVTCEQINWLA